MDARTDIAIRLAGNPVRFQEIDDIEAWYFGTQYEAGKFRRAFPWHQEYEGNRYIPLSERAPYDFGIARAIVDASTGFLFDEGRFPALVAEGDSQDAEVIAAEAWMRAIAEHVDLRAVMLEASRLGGRARSAFVYFKIVDGEPILDTHSGKLCRPTFGRDGKTLERVRKQYKVAGVELAAMGYEGIDPDAEYWYRHDFTQMGEDVYLPVKVETIPQVPTFVLDESRSFAHGLGFVAGVWIANLSQRNGFDGVATYEGPAIGIMHLINETLSQSHRAVKNACDPQTVLELHPESSGEDVSALANIPKGGIWPVPGTMKLLEMAGGGQDVAHKQIEMYRGLLGDVTGWPEIEPGKMSDKAQSAEALRVLFQSAISFASVLRIGYGRGLVELIKVILRVLKATAGATLNVEAYDQDGKPIGVEAISDKPRIKLEWGPWFSLTSNDINQIINGLTTAVAAGLLSQKTAVDHLADLFDRDPDEELNRILEEAQARMDEAMRQAEAMGVNDGDEESEESGDKPEAIG